MESKQTFRQFFDETKSHFVYNEGRGNQRIPARRMMVRLYLKQNACVDCGEDDPVVLEFDHKDPDQKRFSVSRGYRKSLNDFIEEVDKCEIRCANCHRRKTHREQDHLIRRKPSAPEEYQHGLLRKDLVEEKANLRCKLRVELASETAYQRRRASCTPRGAVKEPG